MANHNCRVIIDNTAGMFGDLQGLIGEAMPSIPALEAGRDDEPMSDDESIGQDAIPF
jgi:hypothetical protein